MAELQTIAKTIDGIFRSFPRSSVGMHSVTLRRHDTRRWSGLGWVPTLERGNHKNGKNLDLGIIMLLLYMILVQKLSIIGLGLI